MRLTRLAKSTSPSASASARKPGTEKVTVQETFARGQCRVVVRGPREDVEVWVREWKARWRGHPYYPDAQWRTGEDESPAMVVCVRFTALE